MPDNQPLVQEAYATGSEIAPIVERVEQILVDVPRTHALIALTSIILLIQSPDLDEHQIYEGVKDISRYVCLWLAGTEQASSMIEPVDPSQIN